jgi:hypothetical protein
MAKALTDLQWVALARSKDAARPVLGALHVNGRLEATDGYRLHWAPAPQGIAPGLYDLSFSKLDVGPFPNTGNVIPTAPDFRYAFADVREAMALCAARLAYARAMSKDAPEFVELNGPDLRTAVSARYLLDILSGFVTRQYATPYLFSAPASLNPLYFRGANKREALLMPVRVQLGSPGGRWELAVTSEPQLPVTSEPRS